MIFGIAKGMNGVLIEGFTIHAYTCVYMYSVGGVLGINLTEVSTMLSQGEDFTQFNTTQLRDMVRDLTLNHVHIVDSLYASTHFK